MKFLWQSLFNSQLDKMTESGPENRIRRLEQKVNILLAIAVFQSGMLCFLFASSMIPSTASLSLMVIVGIVGVLVLNKFVPGWAGFAGRMIASLFRKNSNSADVPKKEPLKEDF